MSDSNNNNNNNFLGKLLLGLLGKKTLPNSSVSSPCSPALPSDTPLSPIPLITSTNITDNDDDDDDDYHIESGINNNHVLNKYTITNSSLKNSDKDDIFIKKTYQKLVDESVPTEYERKKVYNKFKNQLLEEGANKELIFNEFYEKTKKFYTDENIKKDIEDLIKIRPIQFLELKDREIDRIKSCLSSFELYEYKEKLLNLVTQLLLPFENDFLKNIEQIFPKLWLYRKTKKFVITNKIKLNCKVKQEFLIEFGDYVNNLSMLNKFRESEREVIKQYKQQQQQQSNSFLPKRKSIELIKPPTMNNTKNEKEQFFLLMFVVYLIQNSSLFSISNLNFKKIIENTIKYLYNDKDEDLKDLININQNEDGDGDGEDEENNHDEVNENDNDDVKQDNEDNYKSLIKVLEKRDYICLAGTGVSIGLAESYISILTWKGLVDSISQEYSSMNNEDTLIKELDEMIKNKEISLVEAVDLLKDNSDSKGLDYKKMVYKILSTAQPTIFSNPSLSIAECLRSLSVPIITTNYDHLLENSLNRQSFENGKKFKDFIDHRDHVYHIHGSMDNINSICLSRDEYILSTPLFLTITAQFRDKPMLMIGVGEGLTDDHFLPFLKHSSSIHYWVCSKESESNKGYRLSTLYSNNIKNVCIVEYIRSDPFSFVNFLWRIVFDSGVEQIIFSNSITINKETKSFNLILSWDSINSCLISSTSDQQKNQLLPTTTTIILNDSSSQSPSFDKTYYYETVYIKRVNEIYTNNFYKKTKTIKVIFFSNDENILNKKIFISSTFNHWDKEPVVFQNGQDGNYLFEINFPRGTTFYQFYVFDNSKYHLKLIVDQPLGKYINDEGKLTKNIINSQSNPNPIQLKFYKLK